MFIFKCFGCIEGDSSLGFPKDDQSGGGGVDRDTLVAPYLQVTASFRADIRQTLKSTGKDELVAAIMELCDDLRDQKLVDLGVRLEDKMDERTFGFIILISKQSPNLCLTETP